MFLSALIPSFAPWFRYSDEVFTKVVHIVIHNLTESLWITQTFRQNLFVNRQSLTTEILTLPLKNPPEQANPFRESQKSERFIRQQAEKTLFCPPKRQRPRLLHPRTRNEKQKGETTKTAALPTVCFTFLKERGRRCHTSFLLSLRQRNPESAISKYRTFFGQV